MKQIARATKGGRMRACPYRVRNKQGYVKGVGTWSCLMCKHNRGVDEAFVTCDYHRESRQTNGGRGHDSDGKRE